MKIIGRRLFLIVVILSFGLGACNLQGLPAPAPDEPGSQPMSTQAPAIDTVIAQLVATERALTVVPSQPAVASATTAATATVIVATNAAVTASPAGPSPSDTPQNTAPPPATTPTAPPVILATAASLPDGALLPAPLLFLSDQNESIQIWRLETDGLTVRQVSNEANLVTAFDVSPIDGRVAYVAGNDLLVMHADGSARTLLVDGPEMPPENDPQRIHYILDRPRWSPDGAAIAYQLNGVNIIASTGGTPHQILTNDPTPLPPDYKSDGPVYFYWPESWAPDGKRLLVAYAIWPESGGLAVIAAAGGELTMIRPVESFACCNPVWSRDGATVLYSSPFFGMILPGMWRSSAADGASQVLIVGDPKTGVYRLPGFVHQAVDGMLYYFYAETAEEPQGDIMLAPVRSDPANMAAHTPLRRDAWLIAEALWAPDGGGVVILDQSSAARSENIVLGKLVYLRSDDSPPVPLPASGFMLRWGR